MKRCWDRAPARDASDFAPQAARDLFELVQSRYGGPVSAFDTDPRTKTTANDGTLFRKPDGTHKLANGFKVLIFVEDYGGDHAVASAH